MLPLAWPPQIGESIELPGPGRVIPVERIAEFVDGPLTGVLEVDPYEPDGSWRSVILEGTYEEFEGGRAEAALALLVQRFSGRRRARTGAPTGRTPVAFRIRCTSATGRRISRTATARALTWFGVAVSRRRARRLARMSAFVHATEPT
jgi:hypothetical protein